MTSDDLVIRTERSVIDIVLSNEGRIIGLEEDVRSLRQEMREEFKDVRAEIAGLRAETQQEFKNVRAETQQEFKNVRQEMKEGFDAVHAEMRVIHERLNSLNDRLGSMQYVLNFGVSVGSLLLVALPLLWAVRKYMSLNIKDIAKEAAREAVREALSQRD